MDKSKIADLLYVIVATGIAWFLLWFGYSVLEIWRFFTSWVFLNLALAISLIVFTTLGGIKQLKQVLD